MYLVLYILLVDFHVHGSQVPNQEESDLIAYDPIRCRSTNYQGIVKVAHDGTRCLEWWGFKSFYLPYWTEETAKKHKNFCRNPANDSDALWCVVAPGRSKYCDIPRCGKFYHN